MKSRSIIQAGVTALVIVLVGILVYAVFFKTREPNTFEKLTQDQQLQKEERFNKALGYLKETNYSDAEKTAILDHPFQPVSGNRTELDLAEADVFYFAKFMNTENDDPTQKYSYLISLRPIDGVLTEEELIKLKTEWKLKSDGASQYVTKQKDEALEGLTEEEKSFIEQYMFESVNGKTTDPRIVATHSTSNLTFSEAAKKADQWMEDPRILSALEKYKTISYKYDAERQK